MNKKNCTVAILLGICLCSVFTREKYEKPATNEVVIITRISVTPAIDDDFYLEYTKINGRTQASHPKMKKGIDRSTITLNSSHGGLFSAGFSYPSENSFLAVTSTIPRSGTIKFHEAKLYPGSPMLNHFEIPLPLGIQVEIPENIKYVYIGSYTFELYGMHFNIEGVETSDEFEEAQAFVREHFGKDVVLVRAPVTMIE